MNYNEEQYYVTHIGICDLPTEPRKRLVFYTQTEQSRKNEFFFIRFNKDTASKKKFINKIINNGKLVALKEPIKIEKEQMLWHDREGNVLLGNNMDSKQDLKFLFKYDELLEARV